ncbi:unnamed protein product (macronuclear) [Paramecium tetraurelia]|uniref:Uncharacterized protein n=1 Tax=Paramecium tetraurelia TaxID=5888 RepID=A0DE56_PARTE|nr:uncharacterized protein GSPATT00016165001 [Paramecium tetraurelia]CAK81323.1 unnamed protein product [Paramecium tetraurelia]|eukprot:XP_001448720.1 hypothetical protein (macronuclear) [Paramecium tetraurelia strain d4-2]
MNPKSHEVIYDTLSLLNPITKLKYINPTLTKDCLHKNACFERDEAVKGIENNIYYCPHCSKPATSLNDLVADWRVNAYKEFNEYAEDVTVISGVVVNKYTRNKKRYLEFFTQTEYMNQFKQMFERASKDSSISSLIQKELESKQQNLNNQQKINFWSFCLQDRVKINIPVRIIGCKHYECYEITSLLSYQDQNKLKKEFLECNQPGCSNRLKIAHRDYTKQSNTPKSPELDEQEKIFDVQTLFSGICVDKDLLTAIKKSNPSSYKFYYNYIDKIIQEDIRIVNGKQADPFIEKIYQQHPDLQSKVSFEDFQKQIQQQAIAITQGDLLQETKELNKQVALYKYRNYTVNMKDKLTQLTIEYPIRCRLCKDLKVCMDMRSFIAQVNYKKKMFPKQGYTCPLCNSQLNQNITSMNISKQIYLDSNMLSYMFKDMSYTNGTQNFEYKGEQYMLQEFLDRQKIKRENYIAKLTDRKVLFKQLFCIVNKDKRIQKPLILQNCPVKNIVDFTSFYEELKKIDFDYEKEDLILCKCSVCSFIPIKTFVGNIYFHEAFYEALNKLSKIEDLKNCTEFSYQFEDTELESKVLNNRAATTNSKIKVVLPPTGVRDASNLQNVTGEEGFLDLMDDEEYQSIFRKTEIQGFEFRTQGLKQNIGGIEIDYQQQGIKANVKEAVEKINQNANQDLKRFQFNVVGMSVELKGDILRQNKGEFSYNIKQ